VMRASTSMRMLALRARVSNIGNAKQSDDDSNEFFHRVSRLLFIGESSADGHNVTLKLSAACHIS
jgi:hypothetical protein